MFAVYQNKCICSSNITVLPKIAECFTTHDLLQGVAIFNHVIRYVVKKPVDVTSAESFLVLVKMFKWLLLFEITLSFLSAFLQIFSQYKQNFYSISI